MITTNMTMAAEIPDAELVALSLDGNRDAFGRIVSRYQSLVCSLAYSATGSLGQSEDLAQETFITAWKHLRHLRERNRLRAWLCGIARNRINNSLRRDGREPLREAEPLDAIHEEPSEKPLPHDQTITNEEAAILWRSLERIPETYREPLILFYREHQSIERVAEQLELTEDAVKQRLSRGRKLLQDQVLAFVEGALARTNPGKAFTVAVLASLPLTLSTSAKAAALGAAAKGASAKAAGVMGIGGALLSPLMVLFGNYIPYRIGLDEATSEEERAHVKRFFRGVVCVSSVVTMIVLAVLWFLLRRQVTTPVRSLDVLMAVFTCFVLIYLVTMFAFAIRGARYRRAYYAKILKEEHHGVIPEPAFEFRSNAKFLGLPLIHIRVGDRFDLLRKPVKAWIAVSNYAVGGLFAFGGVAVAPFSIGALAIGLVPFGGLVGGIFPVGGLAIGVCAFGGFAIGWQAIGGFAFGWRAAVGGLAVANDLASGNVARALQANTDVVRQFVQSNWFFRLAQNIGQHWFWTNLLWMGPLMIQWKLINRKRRLKQGQTANF